MGEAKERLALGQMRGFQYRALNRVMKQPRQVDRMMQRVGAEVGFINWESLVSWLRDNWLSILKVILPIAFLFLQGNRDDHDDTPTLS
jgi:hypothetical protein